MDWFGAPLAPHLVVAMVAPKPLVIGMALVARRGCFENNIVSTVA